MKTLIIVVHPEMEKSVANKAWVAAARRHPEKYTVHELHQVYPDGKIDVAKEQQLLAAHDKIIFQFPFYWFNCPPFFKQWLDEVLTYGWAYGSKSGYQMAGKKVALALSVGINEAEYAPGAKYKYTLAQLTAPFEITFQYIRADYQPFFAWYGLELNAAPEWIQESEAQYLAFLAAF
ncbi:Putative NADPH-quinone reductase (modulator of drug activity B) [Chitinophaga jiangningensis]|uniref:Putative NADPH-quinone reductase (Modulator of drug activity B) n=1 Tax=Chitinophaga jiangningensis TaxID=1419482 RepID=A0A1M7N4I0_9BACT|nr:NAD(P)H-dependent oxidoreductase [Chitinophaga jiangningensis]SHM98386.1 Putative NADPH-quinone reductase (modulator of drug activity B) [Chitinophaga jiangningensis]